MSDWQSFYVIVGSSGAALIGIQFVVMTLIASRRQRPTAESLNAFGTPTVVHLVGSLLISAIMSAPWHSLFPARIVRHRSRSARPAAHRDPQRLGYGNAHRRPRFT